MLPLKTLTKKGIPVAGTTYVLHKEWGSALFPTLNSFVLPQEPIKPPKETHLNTGIPILSLCVHLGFTSLELLSLYSALSLLWKFLDPIFIAPPDGHFRCWLCAWLSESLPLWAPSFPFLSAELAVSLSSRAALQWINGTATSLNPHIFVYFMILWGEDREYLERRHIPALWVSGVDTWKARDHSAESKWSPKSPVAPQAAALCLVLCLICPTLGLGRRR